MSTLLEKALEKVVALPQDEQAEKREVIRRVAREAVEEDERGETLPMHDLL